jgi:hypothetical protein
MKNAIDAINELIKTANIAQSRGALTLKEANDVYLAIEFINNAVQAQQTQVQPQIQKVSTEPQEAI